MKMQHMHNLVAQPRTEHVHAQSQPSCPAELVQHEEDAVVVNLSIAPARMHSASARGKLVFWFAEDAWLQPIIAGFSG